MADSTRFFFFFFTGWFAVPCSAVWIPETIAGDNVVAFCGLTESMDSLGVPPDTTGPPNHPVGAEGDVGDGELCGDGDIGREKLTDERWGPTACSDSWGSFEAALAGMGLFGARSRLTPRPPWREEGGEESRKGGSKLAALCRPDVFLSSPAPLLGNAGTGGASAGDREDARSLPGEGDRNDLSVNDVLLSMPGLELAFELVEFCLDLRLVGALATFVGD